MTGLLHFVDKIVIYIDNIFGLGR